MSLPASDEQVLLLHNPGCSKSRATHALLTERGIAFTERRYLDEPLTAAELGELSQRLGIEPAGFVRNREDAFTASGLGATSDAQAYFRAMAEHPVLVERPIVIRGASARIGRPPEAVLELFD